MLTLRDIIKNKASGFTIIELATVILVIGILATITIVSYNHVQYRANETATAGNVRLYAQALESYRLEHGRYPNITSCLGKAPAGVTTCGGLTYEGAGCSALGVEPGATIFTFSYSNDFHTALAPYLDEEPQALHPTKPVKAKIAEENDCAAYSNLTAPSYQTGTKVTVNTDNVAWISTNWSSGSTTTGIDRANGKAYAIIYTTKNAENCPIAGSYKTSSPLAGTQMLCLVAGGNVIKE